MSEHEQFCEVCGQTYDTRQFDQVRFHLNVPHRPIEVSGIVGTKIGQWIESEGQTMYYEAYIDIFKREEDRLHAALSEMQAKVSGLEAEVSRLKAMVPVWMPFTEWAERRREFRDWLMALENQVYGGVRYVLMVPPIPLPGSDEGRVG
jgi:hypothetical protein